MLPAVTRLERPITGDRHTVPTVWLGSLGRRRPVPHSTFVEWGRCAPVVADFDDPQVPAAIDDVELCMCHEPMSVRWIRIEGHADPARHHDGPERE